MTKLILMLVLAGVVPTAMADDTKVLKDTRTYLDSDGDTRIVVGGEVLTRTGSQCYRKAYERKDTLPTTPPPGKQYIVLPKIEVRYQSFQCDSTGKPI